MFPPQSRFSFWGRLNIQFQSFPQTLKHSMNIFFYFGALSGIHQTHLLHSSCQAVLPTASPSIKRTKNTKKTHINLKQKTKIQETKKQKTKKGSVFPIVWFSFVRATKGHYAHLFWLLFWPVVACPTMYISGLPSPSSLDMRSPTLSENKKSSHKRRGRNRQTLQETGEHSFISSAFMAIFRIL